MNKYFRSLLLMLFPLAGLAANDTTITRNFSVGIDVSPFTYSKWDFPKNQYIESVHEPEEKRDATKRYNAFAFAGTNIYYIFKNNLFIGAGLYYASENLVALVTSDTLDNSYVVYKDILTYKVKYFEIPLSVGYKLADNAKKRKFTYFKVGMNMDFVCHENRQYAYETIYDSNMYGYYHTYLNGNKHSISNSFNRITPFIYIGRERMNKKGTFSFRYGSMFTFKSIYQNHVTAQYYKNYKINPVIFGFAYHF